MRATRQTARRWHVPPVRTTLLILKPCEERLVRNVERTTQQLILLGGIDLHGVASGSADVILAQPKAVAFLACLALAPERRFQRRDRLVALLWPELDQAHARAALRKVVHVVRAALGPEAIVSRGDEEVSLADTIWCDVEEFTMRADSGRLDHALQLYRGELMPGFHVPGCTDLDFWLEEERTAARERAAAAAWALACRLESDESFTEAGRWARRAVRYTGDDERVLRRAMRMLDRLGDRSGALRLYDDFARRIRQTLDSEPSDESAALMASFKEAR
jgi:DNA-binding SARP family transcriptional activator